MSALDLIVISACVYMVWVTAVLVIASGEDGMPIIRGRPSNPTVRRWLSVAYYPLLVALILLMMAGPIVGGRPEGILLLIIPIILLMAITFGPKSGALYETETGRARTVLAFLLISTIVIPIVLLVLAL